MPFIRPDLAVHYRVNKKKTADNGKNSCLGGFMTELCLKCCAEFTTVARLTSNSELHSFDVITDQSGSVLESLVCYCFGAHPAPLLLLTFVLRITAPVLSFDIGFFHIVFSGQTAS